MIQFSKIKMKMKVGIKYHCKSDRKMNRIWKRFKIEGDKEKVRFESGPIVLKGFWKKILYIRIDILGKVFQEFQKWF